MLDLKTKTSSALDLVFVMGFSDEMEKIAAAVFRSTPASGSVDIRKMMKKQRSSLTSAPKQISKQTDPAPPAPTVDPLQSTRTIQPPPVTAGGL